MRIRGMLILLSVLFLFAGCEDDCAVCPEVEPPVEQEPCSGNALLVPQNYETISEAFAVAVAGDTVYLAPGTYEEYGMTIPSGLVLMGTGTQEDPVVIDAAGQGRIFNCSETDSLIILSGLTLTGGFLTGHDDDGAALRADDSHLLIVNCTFDGNETMTGHGGGIYAFHSTLKLENCRFTRNNAALYGGGLYSYRQPSIQVEFCLFEENVAGYGGSGVHATESGCIISGSVFLNNTGSAATVADGSQVRHCTFNGNEGRGLTARNNCLVENCSFIENVVYGDGAGLHGGAGLEVVNSIFLRNQAYGVYNPDGYGGALRVYGDSLMVTGCDFIDNQAHGGGGAISCKNFSMIHNSRFVGNQADTGGGIYGLYGLEMNQCDLYHNIGLGGATAIHCNSVTLDQCALVGNAGPLWTIYSFEASVLRGCTIAANETDDTGSVLYFGYRDPVSYLTDCIIAFNTGIPVEENSTVPVLEYCDIFGNTHGDWVGVVADQAGVEGNFSLDPLFCNLSLENVFLCSDSPCLPPATGHDEVVGARGSGCSSCGDYFR